MNLSRNFLVLASLFLIVGITIGSYMGGSGDHTLAVSHAHINLLGFTLSISIPLSILITIVMLSINGFFVAIVAELDSK